MIQRKCFKEKHIQNNIGLCLHKLCQKQNDYCIACIDSKHNTHISFFKTYNETKIILLEKQNEYLKLIEKSKQSLQELQDFINQIQEQIAEQYNLIKNMIDHCDKPEITINLHEINLMKSIFHSFSHNTCFNSTEDKEINQCLQNIDSLIQKLSVSFLFKKNQSQYKKSSKVQILDSDESYEFDSESESENQDNETQYESQNIINLQTIENQIQQPIQIIQQKQFESIVVSQSSNINNTEQIVLDQQQNIQNFVNNQVNQQQNIKQFKIFKNQVQAQQQNTPQKFEIKLQPETQNQQNQEKEQKQIDNNSDKLQNEQSDQLEFAQFLRKFHFFSNQEQQILIKGTWLKSKKRYDEAIEQFDLYLAINPNAALAYSFKAEVLKKSGQIEKAKQCCEKSIQLDNNNFMSYYVLGCILQIYDENEKALECFNKSISLNHKFTKALKKKCQVLASIGRDDEAIKICNQSFHLDQQSVWTYLEKSTLLRKQGKQDEALECCEIGLDILNNDKQLLFQKEIVQSEIRSQAG